MAAQEQQLVVAVEVERLQRVQLMNQPRSQQLRHQRLRAMRPQWLRPQRRLPQSMWQTLTQCHYMQPQAVLGQQVLVVY